jgi:ABC-2 type transport system permease protein
MAARERPVWLVARREIVEATRTTSFRVTLLISALALAAIIVVANLSSDEPTTHDVVVAGTDAPARVDALARVGAAAGLAVHVTTAPDDDAARALVADGDADVAVAADGATLTTRQPVDLAGDSDLARVVNVVRADLALDNGLRAAGLTPEQAEQVRASPAPEVVSVQGEDPDEVDPSRIATATITNILLFIMLQTYGQWVLTGVTREKASRVVEVLLSVITPRQLLVGKVLGIGMLALAHAAVLILTAFVTTRIMGVDLTDGIALGDLALAGVWFVLGYGLYCSAYAAAGSLVSRVEDAQSVAFPVMLPLLFGYLVSFSAAGGASTLLWVLAFIPPTAVVAMPTLYAIGEAPLWAMAVSMALTVAAIVLVAGLAAMIYERSVLHSGKKLGWKEAFRRPREITAPSGARVVTD